MPRATIQQAQNNYQNSIAIVPERYEMGVQNADWKTAVSSEQAKRNWDDGVTAAMQNNSWRRGVENVSNETWKNAAATKGRNSIAEGMRMGADKYVRNFQPVLEAMNQAASSLPPRTSDYRQNITARVLPVVQAAKRAAGKPT